MLFVNKSKVKQLTKNNFYDAGFDIASAENVIIPSWGSKVISTGLYLEIIPGWVGILKSRSGLSVKNNIEVGAGVIDSEYRGEVKVHLYNFSDIEAKIEKGDRVAQLLVIQIHLYNFTEVGKLDETKRGENGFGSSGK